MKLNAKTSILTLFFGLSLFFTKQMNFLFYYSTDSPDFDDYYIYLEYLANNISSTGREQGLFYYYLQSWYFYLFNSGFEDPTFLTYLHRSIQQVNFLLYVLGLIGLFILFKKYNYKTNAILCSLIFLNFLPLSIMQRIIFKPEILSFALLPWLIFSLESFRTSRKFKYLIFGLIFFVISIASKGSVLAMYLVFFLIFYGKLIFQLNKKQFISIFILFFVMLSFLLYEDISSNGQNLVQLESGSTLDPTYDFKAPLSILYDIDMYQLVASPIKYKHSNSFISITLLDTFGDYFDIFWDNDSSLYSKNRKDVIEIRESKVIKGPEFNNIENTAVFYLQNNTDLYMRKIVGLIMSIVFFYIYFKNLKIKNDQRKFLLAPLVGIFVILFHIISGFPVNNFNPSMGDTLKPIYYGHFFVLAAAFLSVRLFDKKIWNRFYLIPYILFVLFIFGFPKAIDEEFKNDLIAINSFSHSCEINSSFLSFIDYVDNKNSFEQRCTESFVQSELNFDFVEYSSYTIKPRFKIFNSLFFLFGTVSILYIFLTNTRLFSSRSFKAK
tara:strand:+ start:1158 stop:2813 length:1656 start_codon:yes stop_codon:yes gene_type:complete